MTAGSEQLRFWVDMALECVRRDHTPALSTGDQRGPFLTSRALGMALAALRDAYAIATGVPKLLTVATPAGLAGASNANVAAAAACHQLLIFRYPKQSRLLDPAFTRWIERYGLAGHDAAEAAGRLYGKAVHAFGTNDATLAATLSYTVPTPPPYAAYQHIAPPNDVTQGYAGSSWGGATPLLSTRVPFAKPPGRINAGTVNPTPHFVADFNKVVAKGVEVRSDGTRTLEEEETGIYWGYDGPSELGTPPRLYLQVALTILDNIEAQGVNRLTKIQELTIIAGIGIGMADAAIDAWHYKYSPEHMMWRPAVGIRHPATGNGTAVPGWLPLGRPDTNGTGQALTPDFPAYPSGHATFGACAFQLLRLFLVQNGQGSFDADGIDTIDFDFVSDEYDGRNTDPRTRAPRDHIVRRHASLWQAIVDNSVSRVFLGVHWQFDGITTAGTGAEADGKFGIPASPKALGKIGGVWLGGQIANKLAPKLGINAGTIAASKM